MTALPETMGPMTAPAGRRRRLLTAVHGPLPRSFSGSTWYCAQAGVAEGVLDGAFALSTNKVNMMLHGSTVLWKLARKVRGRKTGGYKFHPTYSDVLWSQHLAAVADTVVINNAQLFGNTFFRRYRSFNVAPCFFIDGTLTEYFGSYGAVEEMNIDDDVVQRAIEMETEGYRQATRIVAMSRATERNLIEVYGVAPERIAMVVPGANLDDAAVPAPSTHKGWVGEQFTLGFVGLYPQRKGLDRLAAAMRILRDRGKPIRLKVIGRCPPEIAEMDGVSFLGTISKTSDTAHFIDVLRSVDLGCQLSRAELTGIAMMEFLRLGVPIMATATAGMLDILADGGGELVPVDITPEQLAAQLDTLMNETDRYQALRQAAVRRAEWASWRRVVTELDQALATVH